MSDRQETLYEVADDLSVKLDILCDALDAGVMNRYNVATSMLTFLTRAATQVKAVIDIEETIFADEAVAANELKYEPIQDELL